VKVFTFTAFGSMLFAKSQDHYPLFLGFHVFVRIDDQRQHLNAADHRGMTQMTDGHVRKRKIIPDPAIAVIVIAGPNCGFFMREIFYRFASISQGKCLL
jgi:hypothetical protein